MWTHRSLQTRLAIHSAGRAILLLVTLALVAGAGRRPVANEPTGPCPFPDCADRACVLENPEQRARVGTRCEIHPRTKLELDFVEVRHGIVGYTPGLGGDERLRFLNARPWWSAGCVSFGIPLTEVAYCTECRAVWRFTSAWEKLRHLGQPRRVGP